MLCTFKWAMLFSAISGLIAVPAFAGDGGKVGRDSSRSGAQTDWSYKGIDGPQAWGDLDAAYGQCSTGAQQSPIDLKDARVIRPAPIDIKWKPFVPTVLNNGHTIQVNTRGKGEMVLDGKTYTLLQYHFHHNSEHTINGRHYPLEAHFVHQAADGTLGVLGVFFAEGSSNPSLQKIWDIAPLQRGKMDAKKKFRPTALLPRDRAYFRYEGSLTTPPCSEIVEWAIFSQPLQASKAQIEAFAGLYAHNNRPVQKTNRRYILHTR